VTKKAGRLPLSDDACISLIHYSEEDDFVDFKETFDHSTNSISWLDLILTSVDFENSLNSPAKLS
jgi:hypothetical protein